MSSIKNYEAQTGTFLDLNSKEYNLIDYPGSFITTDVRRRYSHIGKAFNLTIQESITPGTTKTFYAKNTSTDKIIIVDQVYFNTGELSIEFIENGTYTLNENPYTLNTNTALSCYNFNREYQDQSYFKIYVQDSGLLKTGGKVFSKEYKESTTHSNLQWVFAPGYEVTAQFKSVASSANPVPYFLRLTWYEVDI